VLKEAEALRTIGPSLPKTDMEALVAQAGVEEKKRVRRNSINVVSPGLLKDGLAELS
jgi:hypothetical protein